MMRTTLTRSMDKIPSLRIFYQSNKLDGCILEEQEYQTFYKDACNTSFWKDHSTNECIILLNGSKKKAWQKALEEIKDMMKKLRRKLRFEDETAISNSDVVHLFYGQNSPLYFIFREKNGMELQ